MGLVVDMQHMLHRELRVPLRGGEALVAEHLLDRSQVRAFFEHVRSESVAQGMRMHVGRQSLGDGDFLDDAAYAARGEASATPVDEERCCLLPLPEISRCRAGR